MIDCLDCGSEAVVCSMLDVYVIITVRRDSIGALVKLARKLKFFNREKVRRDKEKKNKENVEKYQANARLAKYSQVKASFRRVYANSAKHEGKIACPWEASMDASGLQPHAAEQRA